ncbi:MAG: hypothetical protein ACOYM3_15160 [Terrimicrobiaceae bacterium]
MLKKSIKQPMTTTENAKINGRGDSAAKTEIPTGERIEKQAFFAMKLLRASIPLEEEPAGLCVKREDSWTLSYGGEYIVDLPPVPSSEAVISLIIDAGLPLPRITSRRGNGLPGPSMGSIHYATWRKNRHGEWVLFGPERVLKDRRGPVDVKKADGTIERRRVRCISKPFMVEGEPYCYARAIEKRICVECGGWHCMDEVRGIYAGGVMGTGAYWRQGEESCSCGGRLAKKETYA